MSFSPYNLRVNYVKSPYAVVEDMNPVFTWAVKGAKSGRSQEKYHIVVSFENIVLWDSGFVKSDCMSAVYPLDNLPSGAKIEWSIEVTDDCGEHSSAERAFFTTACFEEINAKWIASSLENGHNVQYFSKKIILDKIPERAVVYHCGLGYGKAYVNGKELNRTHLNPAFTNYVKECLYVTDVIDTAMLKKGENTVSIAVAGGWRKNYGHYLTNMSEERKIEFMGDMCLKAQIVFWFADGTKMISETDTDWDCETGPLTFSHLFDGETYDEEYIKKTEKAIISDFETENFHAQTLEPICVKKEIRPVFEYNLSGKIIYDFGENLAGVVRIKAAGTANGAVSFRLRHAETTNDSGEIYTVPLRGALQSDCYKAKSGECNFEWTPEFTYHGFRFAELEIDGDFDGSVELTALSLYTDIDTEGYFKCGNPVFNEIYNAAVRTERCNLHSIATDCPQRDERMGWMNDSTVRFMSMNYTFSTAQLFNKIVNDITNEQDELGRITCTVPFVYGNRPADPVCSSYLIAAMEHYRLTGSNAVIKKHYKNFIKWNEFLSGCAENGIVNYSYYGDWAGPEDCCTSGICNSEEFDSGAAHSKYIPGEMVSTGCHYLNYKLLASFAEIAGNNEDKIKFEESAEKVKKAYLDKWFDSESGKIYNGSQACQAFSLFLEIIPEEYSKKAADIMAEAVKNSGYRIQTANITTSMLVDMLSKYGYTDIAWKLLTRTEYPSWGYMLANGATTIWERFELKKDGGMNSHNHPMYGAVTGWIWRSLIGFKATEINKKFEICPNIPEDLLYFETVIPLLCGNLYIKYEKRYGQINLFTDIPFGTEATVKICGREFVQKSGFNTINIALEELK